jgi:STE24 endopeptidase
MRPATALILAALLLEHGVRVMGDLLNLRMLDPVVPPEFRDVYDEEHYHRAQEYTRARLCLGLVASTGELAVTLGFWLLGGFGWLDELARRAGGGAVGTALLFVGGLLLGRAVLGLPAACWSTFVVEERFGFNRTSARTFWADRARGLVLALLLGGPVLATIVWLLSVGGPAAWVWCWGVSTVATVILQIVAPTWILPRFNRFTRLADGPLRDAILGYARQEGYPVEDVWVIDGSRRSTKANAFFTGFGRRKRLALFDTLLETLDPEATVAVVAHEVGHYRRGHVVQGVVLAILHLGLLFWLLSLVLQGPQLALALGVAAPSLHAGLVVFALLLGPLELVLSVLLHAWSRHNERQADRFAIETTGAGDALARGLRRLSVDGLSNLTPHPLYVLLHYSHPPLAQRLQALAGAPRGSRSAPAS